MFLMTLEDGPWCGPFLFLVIHYNLLDQFGPAGLMPNQLCGLHFGLMLAQGMLSTSPLLGECLC